MNRTATLAAVVLLASGCIPDTAKIDPLRSAASVCPVLFDLLTAKLEACSGVAPYQADASYAGALATCGTITAAEQAGRIGYDRAIAEACIDALGAPGCAGLQDGCADSPFVPRVAPGGLCVNDLECTAASSGCYNPDRVCPATCMPPGVPGDRCSDIDPPCGAASYCDTTTTPATPTCAARSAAGAACSAIPCILGQYCDASVSPPNCKKQLSQGAACTSGQCDETLNLFCDPVTSTCKLPPTTASGLGGPCGSPYRCATNLWCDYSLALPSCKAKVPVPQACIADGECSTAGAACVLDSVGAPTSHCMILLTEGTSCTPGLNACQGGLACIQGTGGLSRCTRSPLVGGACGTILGELVLCGAGWCDRPGTPQPLQGTCQAAVADGQPCPNYVECGQGGFGFSQARCENVPNVGQICVAPCPVP